MRSKETNMAAVVFFLLSRHGFEKKAMIDPVEAFLLVKADPLTVLNDISRKMNTFRDVPTILKFTGLSQP